MRVVSASEKKVPLAGCVPRLMLLLQGAAVAQAFVFPGPAASNACEMKAVSRYPCRCIVGGGSRNTSCFRRCTKDALSLYLLSFGMK